MYVCVCNSVTDKDIYQAVEQGLSSFEQLQADLKVATQCGRCEDYARLVLDKAIVQKAKQAIINAAA